MKSTSGVYAIRHNPSGKTYIGSSMHIERRWSEHVYLLRCGKHHARHLQFAWKKHGESQFSFVILSECSRLELIEEEQVHITVWKPEYNTAPVAGSRLGVTQSPEFVEKHRQRLRDEWADPNKRARRMQGMANVDRAALQEKRRTTLAEKHPGGVKMPESFSAMLSERNRAKKGIPSGRVFSEETRAKISASNKACHAEGRRDVKGEHHPMFGKTHSNEAKAKMSAAKKNRRSARRPDPSKCSKGLHEWDEARDECLPCRRDTDRLRKERALHATNGV